MLVSPQYVWETKLKNVREKLKISAREEALREKKKNKDAREAGKVEQRKGKSPRF